MRSLIIILLSLFSLNVLAADKSPTLITCNECSSLSQAQDKAYAELKKNYSLIGNARRFEYYGYNISETYYVLNRSKSVFYSLKTTCGPSMRGQEWAECSLQENHLLASTDPMGVAISNLVGKYKDTFICSECDSWSDAAYAAFTRIEDISAVIGEYNNYGSWQPPRTSSYLVLDLNNKKAYDVTQQCVEISQPNYHGFKSSCGFSARLDTNQYTTDLAESLGVLHDNGAVVYQEFKSYSNLAVRAIAVDISTQEVPIEVLPSAWDLVGANYNQNMVAGWYNNKTDYLSQIEFTGWKVLEGLGFIEGIRVPMSFSDGSTAWFSVDSTPVGDFGSIPLNSDSAFLVGQDTDFNTIFKDKDLYASTAFKFSRGGWPAFLKFVDALGRFGFDVRYDNVDKEGIESGKPVFVNNIIGGLSINYTSRHGASDSDHGGNSGGDSFDFGGLAPGEQDIDIPNFIYFPVFPGGSNSGFNVEVGPVTVPEDEYNCWTDPDCD